MPIKSALSSLSRRFDPRLTLALLASRTAGRVIRRLGRGGGTSAPGLIANRIDPRLLAKLSTALPDGVVVVAGTNGKTTTSRMIADIFEASGRQVIHNRSGSNLLRGVVSTFADSATLTGQPRGDIAVIEADEAALPDIVRLTHPRIIMLNNLFRDQLDRYGELDVIARNWRAAFQGLDASTTMIINADDPTLASITEDLAAQRVSFGLDEQTHRLDATPHAVDAGECRRCGARLDYHARYVSHLGDWYCPNGDSARPQLDITGGDIELKGVDALAMTIRTGDREEAVNVGIPGIYNAYNTVAAVAVTHQIGIPGRTTREALAAFRSAFGRIERVAYQGRNLTLALVKNPVGFNEVLRMLTAETGGLSVPTMIALNDLYADGRDVSWIWDVDFEMLAAGDGQLSTSGLRGADMANRLKYAGVPESRITELPEDLTQGLDAFVDALPEGATAYILPTYTAMLGIRKTLADRGAVETFWDQ